MKKQILSAILMAAVILTTTACSGKTESSEPSSPSESEVTAEAAPESTPAATAEKQERAEESAVASEEVTSAAATAPEEAAEPAELLHIAGNCEFVGNSLYFEADNGERYFYDIPENTLTKCDKSWPLGGALFKVGDLVGRAYFDGDYSFAIDTKTNEYLLNEENDGYRVCAANDTQGRIIVTKLEKSFSGNKILIGMMNGKGEWIYPMTELPDDKITAEVISKYYDNYYIIMGDYAMIMNGSGYIYSFKENTLSKAENPDSLSIYNCYWNKDKDKVVSTRGYNGVWLFDSTGKGTMILDNADRVISAGDGIITQVGEKWTVLSWDDYKDMGFDLSGYDVTELLGVTKDVIAFSANNPDGDIYIILMNKDGSLVTEPFRGTSGSILGFCGDYFVLNVKAGNTVINCKNGEKKTPENTITAIDGKLGVMVVRADGCRYLAYPNDPDTLLNPFELAAQ